MRAKCNDDLSTVNFSTIGLDVHKNRLVACAVHVQHDAKGREVHEKEYFESTGTYSGRQRLTEWCSSQNADLILRKLFKKPRAKPDGTKMFCSAFLNDARMCCFFANAIVKY